MMMIQESLKVLLTLIIVSSRGKTKECGHFPQQDQFLLNDRTDSLAPNASVSVGHLVIVPEMRFNCHGYITGWSALVQFASNEAAIDHLFHDITFQVWRPILVDNELFYTFVGSQVIDFVSDGLREHLVEVNNTQYLNFTTAQPREPGERLVFQPGDVIGWYIHTLVQVTQIPLTVVYRSPEGDVSGLHPVDMYTSWIADTMSAATEPPCRLSLQNNHTTLIPSVLPYVTVDYTYVSSGERMCISDDIIDPSKPVQISTSIYEVEESPTPHQTQTKDGATFIVAPSPSENNYYSSMPPPHLLSTGTAFSSYRNINSTSTVTTNIQNKPPNSSRGSSGLDGLLSVLIGLVVILTVIIMMMALIIVWLLVLLKKHKSQHLPIPLEKF